MAKGDTTLRQIVGYNLTRSNSAVLGTLAAVLEPFGLRRVTYSALNVIHHRPGLRQADLADALAIDRANLVLIVSELVAAGLVTRERSTEDRRAYALNTTEAGAKISTASSAAVEAYDDAITRGLSDAERAQFIELLQKVEHNAMTCEVSDDTRTLSVS